MEGTEFDEIELFRRIGENGARALLIVTTIDGEEVLLDDLWARRVSVPLSPNISIVIPCLDDLVTTKRFAARAKDLEDIRLLLALRESGGGT